MANDAAAEASKKEEEAPEQQKRKLEGPGEAPPPAKKARGDEDTAAEGKEEDMIALNVGGTRLVTTRTTLRMCAYYEKLLKHDDEGTLRAKRDETGALFVDRNGETFALVLDYLRDGVLPVADSADDLRRVLVDAQFYGIDDLAARCDARLAELAALATNKNVVVLQHVAAAAKDVVSKTAEDEPPAQPQRERTPLSASAFNDEDF
mmetsp:Transcript_29203/g.89338  ORF Transcript_29203/g.89338 Transcript_29203/m.89338 type:complete len:206 (-) Transcript_29203:3798-4415(-)